ncbi:MAG: DNA (cytosine-5-)-methyltransferase [Phocaeicola sp.]
MLIERAWAIPNKSDLCEFENVNGGVESQPTKPIRLLSLFSGIGAFEKALDRENIPYKLASFCEIDKFAVKSYCAVHGVSEDKNLGDISKVASADIPDCDLVTFGFPCVPKGSMVKTINGYVAIENIAVGDMVLTHNNRYKKVLRTMNRVSDHIYHIKGAGVSDLRITDEHPLYVLRNGKFEWVKVKDLKTTDMLTYNIHQGETSTGYSKDTLWLMGRYCADGYRENHAMHRPIFCIGRNKIDDFEKHLGGISYSVGHTERNCIEYKVLDTEFSALLDSFGTGSTKKVIPQEIIEAPVDEVMAFLDGYLAGDGHKRKDRNEVMFCTASEQMGLGLALLVARVEHIVPSVYKRVDTRKESFSDTFCYQFSPRSAKQSVVNDKICTHIKSISKEDTDIEVFNIEVEGDNSYTVSNVIVHNCQDISVAGNQNGIVAGVTRSGLLYEALRIIEDKKPPYAICENVKNLVGKKFKPDFDKLLFMLDELGYNSYWQVLNAKDYGIPQNRERVFVISIRKDIDNGTFKFPEKFPLELRLKDMLEGDVDEKFYLAPKQIKCLNVNEPKGADILHVGNTKSGGQKSDIILADGISSCLNATDYKQPKQIVTPAYESVTQVNDNYAMLNGGKIGKMHDISRRAYYEDSVAPTIHTSGGGNQGPKVIRHDFRIRKLTPKECWRLMGFDDGDFDKAKGAGISPTQLYKQAGNSIVVDVLQYIFRNLFRSGTINEM